MKTLGAWVLCIGALWLTYAWIMDTTVALPFSNYGERVHNLGLIEARRTHLVLASVAALAGIVLIGFGHVQGQSGGDRSCPFCAESIRPEATFCKHCRKDVPAMQVDRSGSSDSDTTALKHSYRELAKAAEKAEAAARRPRGIKQ